MPQSPLLGTSAIPSIPITSTNIGVVPPSPLTSTDLQAIIDEMQTEIAAGIGGKGGTFAIGCVMDAGTSAITGNPNVEVTIPAAGTLTSWTLLADASGSAVIDVQKCTYSGFPGSLATLINTGAGGVKPTLTSQQKNQDSTLAHWTTSLAAGDVIRFHLDSSTTVKRLAFTMMYTRT